MKRMDARNMNLFWKQGERPELRESDKENNVTHALLVTLKENKEFLNSLLKTVGSQNKIKRPTIYFQVPLKIKHKTTNSQEKIILSIVSKHNHSERDDPENPMKKKDIPDGLILDKNISVLIESKVSAVKDHGQLRRYNQTFYQGAGEVKTITWEEIYNLAKRQNRGSKIGDYILNQFKEYIEVINLNGFNGIPFFDKSESGENYEKEFASEVLKRLVIEFKEENFFKQHHFKIAERPKTGQAWDYFYSEEITKTNPRTFPHYSIYIFDEFFGLDVLFHRKEFKKIIKNKKEDFFALIKEIADKSADYYLTFIHYRKIANKDKYSYARTGRDYTNFEFCVNLKQFIKDNKKDWQKRLEQYFNLILKEKFKQISLCKKAFYYDRAYENLNNAKGVINFIKDSVTDTKDIYKMMLESYK